MKAVAAFFQPAELARVREAARHRRLPLDGFVREAAIVLANETLTAPRAELDPGARQRTPSFPEPPNLRRG